MTLRHMKIFCALVENDCNTTKTAEALNMTQPAISQAIHEMEEYYSVKLFDRIRRKLVITDAGRYLFKQAKHISSLFEDTEKELSETETKGKLSVGGSLTIGSLFLPEFISTYEKIHPDTEIKGIVAPTNVLEQKILSFELDFALIEGIAHSRDLIIEEFMDDELCVVSAANGKYSDGQVISIEEFKKEKILVREASSGTREVLDHATEKAGFSINPVFESYSSTGIINAALCGIGIAVIPYRVAFPYINYGALVKIEVKGLDLGRKFFVIRHREKELSSPAKDFLDFCRSFETELPAPIYIK